MTKGNVILTIFLPFPLITSDQELEFYGQKKNQLSHLSNEIIKYLIRSRDVKAAASFRRSLVLTFISIVSLPPSLSTKYMVVSI